MKRLCAMMMVLVLALTALPVFAHAESPAEEIVRKVEETVLPGGSMLKTIHKVANDDTMDPEEKMIRVATGLATDVLGMIVPGSKGIINEMAQDALDKAIDEMPDLNICENDKRKINEYMKAVDKGFTEITEKVTDFVEDVCEDLASNAVYYAKSAINSAKNFFTGWF